MPETTDEGHPIFPDATDEFNMAERFRQDWKTKNGRDLQYRRGAYTSHYKHFYDRDVSEDQIGDGFSDDAMRLQILAYLRKGNVWVCGRPRPLVVSRQKVNGVFEALKMLLELQEAERNPRRRFDINRVAPGLGSTLAE